MHTGNRRHAHAGNALLEMQLPLYYSGQRFCRGFAGSKARDRVGERVDTGT